MNFNNWTWTFLAWLPILACTTYASDVTNRISNLLLYCESVEEYSVDVRIESFPFDHHGEHLGTAYASLASRSWKTPSSRIDAFIQLDGVT